VELLLCPRGEVRGYDVSDACAWFERFVAGQKILTLVKDSLERFSGPLGQAASAHQGKTIKTLAIP